MTERAEIARRARPKRDAAATQKRLLDAAEAEFAAKGFDGARLGAIALAADAQQALVHHYFGDKEGLYRAVLTRAVEAVSVEGWGILERVPAPALRDKKAKTIDVRPLVDAFVESLHRFFSSHAPLLAIVRHDAQAGGAFTRDLVGRTTKPVFEACVALIEDLARRGIVRADVDARHICISTCAMCTFPYRDEAFFSAIWPIDVKSRAFMEDRRREVVDTVMARLQRTSP